MNSDSVARTLLVAAAVALASSALMAGAVYVLRPLQAAYQQVDRNRALLEAAGLIAGDADDGTVISAYRNVDVRLVDMAGDVLTDDAPVADVRTYDHWGLTESSPAELVLDSRETAPGPPPHARYLPVYLLWRDDEIERIVLPVHGPGMWSTIYAYLALRDDFDTVAGFEVYRHGETPGIGDRIEDARWLASWTGKRVYGSNGDVRIDVVRDPRLAEFHVDLISGASVTSESVAAMVRSWAGPDGYGPLLDRLRRGDPPLRAPRG